MIRYLLLLVTLLCLDLLLLPVVNFWVADSSTEIQAAARFFHFVVPVSLVTLLIGNVSFRLRKKYRRTFTTTINAFQLIYVCKLFVLTVLMFFWLAELLTWILDRSDLQESQPSVLKYYVASFVGVIPFTVLLYGIIVNKYRYQLRKIKVPIKDLPVELEGLRIVQISDVHSGSLFNKAGIRKGVRIINNQNPDLVFFTGDLVNNRAIELLPFLKIFGKIRAKYGVFSVLGNHDYGDYVMWRNRQEKIANLERLVDFQKEMNWQLLRNENQVISIGKSKVAVIGVENYSAKLQFTRYGDLLKSLDNVNRVDLKLLLSHDPSHWRFEVLKYPDIDITFSGHTHGMQFGIEIGEWIKWSPVQYVYKEWAGLYQEGDQYLYVNRGFGVLGYPGRVGILPEITVLELTKAVL
ncbi:MAG: metallophosphoesterase [Bacteroidia bacterium]|nr:metallophosphoesterase [Bacteroidia bacterium]